MSYIFIKKLINKTSKLFNFAPIKQKLQRNGQRKYIFNPSVLKSISILAIIYF